MIASEDSKGSSLNVITQKVMHIPFTFYSPSAKILILIPELAAISSVFIKATFKVTGKSTDYNDTFAQMLSRP